MYIFGYDLEKIGQLEDVKSESGSAMVAETEAETTDAMFAADQYILRVSPLRLPDYLTIKSFDISPDQIREGVCEDRSQRNVFVDMIETYCERDKRMKVNQKFSVRADDDKFGRAVTDLRRNMTCDDTKPFARKDSG